MSKTPLVSIGLPVYNGQRYLALALDSLLAQTYTNIELVVCDNASTDSTESIVRHYAGGDPRVRYVRNPVNLGGVANHNLAFTLSRGVYYTPAAYDDLREPTNIERCVAVLEQDAGAVLCYTGIVRIDEQGRETAEPESTIRADVTDAVQRFAELIRLNYRLEPTYGLMRAGVMRRTVLEGLYPDSDRVFLAEMALYGRFVRIPEPLFYRREHDQRSVRMYPSRRQRMAWIKPGQPVGLIFPYCRQWTELVRSVRRAEVPFGLKIRTVPALLGWLVQYRRQLFTDLVYAAKWILKGLAGRDRTA
jgi:glycosyltransferase involved in cell wall biosynthesis